MRPTPRSTLFPYTTLFRSVDGANAWWRFWSVTLPVMSPTIFFATVITFIGAFQIFDPMVIMTQRSEEHTSELQSRRDLVCRLLLEYKKITMKTPEVFIDPS